MEDEDMGVWQDRVAKALARNFGWVIACAVVAALIVSKSTPPSILQKGQPAPVVEEQQRLFESESVLRNALRNQLYEEVDAVKNILNTVACEVENENFDIERFLTEVEEHCRRLRSLREAIERIEKDGLYIR